MHISMLQFVWNGENTPVEWRMVPGTAKLRQFVCIQEDSVTLERFETSIIYALTGKNRSGLSRVTIEIVDNDGDVWRIERNMSDGCRITRNSQPIRQDLDRTAIGALLDLDTSDDPERASLANIVARHFEVLLEQGKLVAQQTEDRQFSASRLVEISRKKQHDLTAECAQLFQLKQLNNPKLLIKLIAKIEPLYFQITELIRQKRNLREVNHHIHDLASDSIAAIENQISMLSEIERVGSPLNEPAQSPGLVQEKLNHLNHRLQELSQLCGVTEAPSFAGDVPWDKIFAARARLEAFDRLIQAGEDMRKANEENIRPAFDAALATVRTLLTKSNQLTSELESCLNSVTVHSNRIVEYSNLVKSSGIKGKIANFIKPKSAATLDDEHADPARGLDGIRSSIDFTLTKLGELLATTQGAEAERNQTQDALQAQLEKLFAEFTRLRAVWQRLAQPFGIPEHIKFSELVQLASRHAEMVQLREEQNRLLMLQQTRNQTLAKLEKLIIGYRQSIGSQKDMPLATAEIIIAEAQNLIRYKDRKIEHLNRLRGSEREIELFNRQKESINDRLRGLLKTWGESFEQLNIPTIQVNNQSLLTLFQRVKIIQALDQIIHESARSLPVSEIFSERHCDAPVVFVWWRPSAGSSKHAIELLKEIEGATANSLYVICTTDEVFSEYLQKSGATRGHFQTQKSLPTTQNIPSAVEPRVEDPNSVRHERARRMMSVFESARMKQLGRNA